MSDVVIIGGGIVGCACAYELAKAGAGVTLLEYGKTGMQATNAAAGMLSPMIDPHRAQAMVQFGLRALHEYPDDVAELEREAGFSVEYMPQGVLRVAFGERGAEALRRAFDVQQEMGFPLDWLDAAALREFEPRLTERARAGVYSGTEGNISNQLVTLALERAAVKRGAKFRERSPVIGFTTRGGHVSAVRTPDATLSCDTVIIAAGARSGQIAAKLHASLPVVPVRGQMLAFGGMHAPIHHVVGGPRGYLVPRANGLIFAGATVENVGFRRRTTKSGIRAMLKMSHELVPQLEAAQVEFEWAGLRPGTPDELPIIGPLPGWPNVIAATGHYRNGILLGPLTGKLVAQGILHNDWTKVPPEFSPARFANDQNTPQAAPANSTDLAP
jgi:glycine oxidase